MQKKISCALCGGLTFTVLRDTLRHGVKRKVLKCKKCSLVFLEPKIFSAGDFYGDIYRNTYTPVIGEKTNSQQIFDLYQPYQAERVTRLKPILRKNMKVLDIGCSAGHFLYTLRPHVTECIGLEFNKKDVVFMNKKLGIKAYNVPLPETDLPKKYFDLITVFQTFEHVEDPHTFLHSIADYLADDGYLAIEVPNVDEALLSVYDITEYADFCFKEVHIYYYAPQTLQQMLESSGFTGTTVSVQRINFLNHVNWIKTKGPEKGPYIHMAIPELVTGEKASTKVGKALNSWIVKTDTEYRKLLNHYNIGESLWFVGQKKNEKKNLRH